MGSGWLFRRVTPKAGDIGGYIGGPLKLVIHTTEVDADVDNGWIGNWSSASHVVADPVRRKVIQCVDLGNAAKSLVGGVGVQTNRDGALQVELIGYTDTALADRRGKGEFAVERWGADNYQWLAAEVLAPMCRWAAERGDPIDLDDVPPLSPMAASYGTLAPQRFTNERWDRFGGMCGHRHVPNNSHNDPGMLDLRMLASLTKRALGEQDTDEVTPQDLETIDLLITRRTHEVVAVVRSEVAEALQVVVPLLSPPAPVVPPVPAVPSTPVGYVVALGDSPWKISQAYGITLEVLYDLNPVLRDRPTITVGQVLRVPAKTVA